MWSQFTNVTDRQTDRRTDRQTTCDRNTALCTKVHRAVKTNSLKLFTATVNTQLSLVLYRQRHMSQGDRWPSDAVCSCSVTSWFVTILVGIYLQRNEVVTSDLYYLPTKTYLPSPKYRECATHLRLLPFLQDLEQFNDDLRQEQSFRLNIYCGFSIYYDSLHFRSVKHRLTF